MNTIRAFKSIVLFCLMAACSYSANGQTPVITANGSTTICYGNYRTLTVSSCTGCTYQWKLNGTNVNGATGVNYNAFQQGSYTCSYTNVAGNPVSNTIVINVISTSATITSSGPTSFCLNPQPVTLSAPVNASYSYQWYLNTGFNNPIAGATSDTYLIPVNANGGYSCKITNNVCIVNSNTIPYANFSSPPPVANVSLVNAGNCPGNGNTVSVPFVPGYTYQWTLNGTNVPPNASNPSYYFAGVNGVIRCLVTNSCGTTLSNAYLNTIMPVVTVSVVGGSTTACSGSIFLSATSNYPAGSAYQWLKNGIAIPNEISGTLVTSLAGDYACRVTVPTCSPYTSNTIAKIGGANIDTTDPLTFCSGSATLTANPSGATYQWKFNGVAIGGANSRTYIASNAGFYSCDVTTATCGTQASNVLTVNTGVSTGILTAPNGADVCSLSGTDLVVLPSNGTNYNFYILYPGGTPTLVQSGPSNIFNAYSTGYYYCELTDACGVVQTNQIAVRSIHSLTQIVGPNNNAACNFAILSVDPNFWDSFQWYKDGVPLPGETNSVLTATQSGNYNCIFSNTCGSDSTYLTFPLSVSNAIPANTVITANTPNATCCGKSFTLSVPNFDGTTYKWYFSGGGGFAQANSTTNMLNFTAPTFNSTYRFYVTMQNACGTVTSLVDTFVFTQNINAAMSANGPLNFCPGNSVTLSVNPLAGATYQWKRNSTVLPNFQSTTCLADSSGTYYVTISDVNGCSASSYKIVYEGAPGTASILGTSSLCAGGTGLLTTTAGLGYSYQWNLNGSPLPNTNNDSININALGTYTVAISSSCGNAGSFSKLVSTGVSPTVTIAITGNNAFCYGDSVKLSASSNQTLSVYQWYRNGLAITGATSSNYYAKNGGSYTVFGNSTSNCSATSSAVVLSTISKPSVTITPSGPTNFCTGSSVTLQANTAAGYTYQWKKNNINISGAVNSSYSTTLSGSYNVIITNTNGCSKTGTAVAVTGPPIVTITPTGNQSICAGDSIKLKAAAGYSNYKWLKNGVVISGANSNTYYAKQAGTYKVRITNQFACSKTTSTANQVSLTVPCRLEGTSENPVSEQLFFSPNPANESVKIFLSAEGITIDLLTVYDINGRQVFHAIPNQSEYQLDLQSWYSGMYLVQVHTSEGNRISNRLLVNHE